MTRGTSAAVLALALAACEGEPQFSYPPIVAVTDRVEYHSDSPLDQCPSAPARVEARLKALETALNVRGPQRVRYSKFPTDEDVKENCKGHVACAWGSDAFSADWADQHEILHTVLPARRPPRLFREGVAVAFSFGTIKPSGSWPAWTDIMDVTEASTYAYGGAFVTYLAATYGIDKVVGFLNSSWGEDQGAGALAQKFSQSFPVSLDDAWQAAASVTGASSLCVGLEPTMSTDGTEAVPAGEDCVGGEAEGRHAFVLDVDTPLGIESTYEWTWVGACGLGVATPFPPQPIAHGGRDVAMFLGAYQKGKYYVNAKVSRTEESFRVRSGAWMGATCDRIVPYHLEEPATLLEVIVRGGIDTWVAIEWAGAEPLEFCTLLGATGYQWSICTACDETRCSALDWHLGLTLQPGVNWLHAVPGPDSLGTTDRITASGRPPR